MRTTRLDGHIVANAEKKISKAGKEFITFRIGNSEKGRNGERETYWYNITSFHHIGLAPYLTKGKPIIVEGDYADSIFQRNDGKTEITRDVLANAIYFMNDSSNERTAQPSAEAPKAAEQEQPKPTTDKIKVPTPVNTDANGGDDDDLPF